MSHNISLLLRIKQKTESFEILLILACARFLVKFVPFRYWQKMISNEGEVPDNKHHISDDDGRVQLARRMAHRIAHIANKAPFKAVCLPQSMTCYWMLARRNISSKIVIGVRKNNENADFDLHAWLNIQNICVMGGQEGNDFAAFQSRDTMNNLDRVE